MRKAVIYARYSSDSQTEQSIEGQLRVCREYAQNNDILIVDTYIDRAMTGTNDNRAAFQKMLKDSSRKEWQYVLLYKLDRFSRNKFESVIHKKTLKDNGVTILSAMENLSDSPEGRMMETILEGFNQYFSEELMQKVNRGLKESWRKGKATGGQDVFGYDVVDKNYVINEYESKIVEEAFLMYSQGYKAVAIAEKFKECGYRRKNGKIVDQKYLYFILHNKRYTGVVEHQGELYDNIFPRIISDDLWDKVNSINEENKLAPSRKKEIFDYILSGKLVCGDCKHKMGGESGTSHTGDIHYYYICLSRRKKRAKCGTKPVQKQWLEDTVINATAQMLSSVSNIKAIAQSILEIHKKETADNTALKLIERKRAEAVKAQNNIVRAIEQGIITDATKSRLTELEAQIAQYDIEINKEKARSYTFLTADDIEMYLSKFVFENTSDIKVRKLIVNTFIREVILYDEEIVITYNFTDSPERVKITKEQVIKTEKEIETADNSAVSSLKGSYILCHTAPITVCKLTNNLQIVIFYRIKSLRNSEKCSILSPKNKSQSVRKKIMRLREYESSDCKQLAELFYLTVHHVNTKDYNPAQLNAWATGTVDLREWDRSFLKNKTIVAVEDEKIVGFGNIDATGYLDMLYVHKDYQRQGVASAICDMLEQFSNGKAVITHSSITAKPFFINRGYHVVKRQEVIRRGIALVNYVMEKPIPETK